MKRERLFDFLILIAIACVAAFTIYSGYHVAQIKSGYVEREKTYAALAEKYTADNTELDPAVHEKKERCPISVDFQDLNSECKFGSVAGWLFCEGTVINYPVAQCSDNYYYLTHLYDGSENGSGSLYVDFACADNFRGENTIIYGHHMADETMFGGLKNYLRTPGYFAAHPSMYLSTPSSNYRVDIFSGFRTTTEDDKTFRTSFSSDYTYREHLERLINLNEIDALGSVEISSTERIVTLVTCSYETDNSRTVICGKLIEIE